MNEMMQFPNTVEEFMEQYKIVDTEQVYTNGAELVPIFRMKQWFEHIEALPSAQPEIIRCKDCMFWRRDRISCEGYAMCQTGEGGIRFRRENDYCSVARRRTDE